MQERGVSRRWIQTPNQSAVIVIGIAVLLALPLLGSGFAMDDYWLIAKTSAGGATHPAPIWDLFQLWPIPNGQGGILEVPWFADPDAKMHFFRPLSSLGFALDLEIFGPRALGPQLLNIGWWLLLLLAIWRVFREILPNPTVALIALSVYALDDAHAMGIVWVCGRHMLMSCTFFSFAWLLHLRARMTKRPLFRWLSSLLWIASLLSGESGLALIFLVIAQELLDRDRSTTSVLKCLGSGLLFWWIPAITWLLFYIAKGYGATGQDLYLSPWHFPLRFLELAWLRIPAVLLSGILFFPSDPLIMVESNRWASAILAAGLAFTVGLVGYIIVRQLHDSWRRQAIHYFTASLGIAFLYATSPSQDRQLLGIGIGLAVPLALVLGAWTRDQPLDPHSSSPGDPITLFRNCWVRTNRGWIRGLFLLHLGLSPLILPLRCYAHRLFAQMQNSPAWNLGDTLGHNPPHTLVFLTSPGVLRGIASLSILQALGKPAPDQSVTLYSGHLKSQIHRRAGNELCLAVGSGIEKSIENRAIAGIDWAPDLRKTFQRSGIDIRVTQDPSTLGSKIICARWRSPQDLEASTLVYWTDLGYRRIDAPARNERIQLPASHWIPMPVAAQNQ